MSSRPIAATILPLLSLVGCASTPGVDPADAARAADYAVAHGGTAILVLQHGAVVHESFHRGWDPDEPHGLASGTKSFWGPLAACAVDDGLLDLDEPASATLSAWRDDDRHARITTRQLLDFTSGLAPAVYETREEGLTADLYARALAMPVETDPGTAWNYGSTNHTAFGALLEARLRQRDPADSTERYLERRLLEPLDLHTAGWRRDGAGHLHAASGASFTPREWARFGEFIRTGGLDPSGRRLVSAHTLAACFVASDVFPRYGLSWWIGTTGGAEAGLPDDLVMAAGAGKQVLCVIPSRGLTIVRQGDDESFDTATFVAIVLGLR